MKRMTIILCALALIGLAVWAQARTTVVVVGQGAAAATQYTKYITENTATFNSIEYSAGSVYTGVADTYLREQNPTFNYGLTSEIRVSKYSAGDHQHGLIVFSGLSNLSGKTIVSAEIGIYKVSDLSQTSSQTFDLRKVSVTWDEGTALGDTGVASWNTRTGATAWTTAGGISDGNDRSATVSCQMSVAAADTGWQTCTSSGLASDVQSMIGGSNYGWHIERNGSGNDNTSVSMRATKNAFNSDDGYYPYLKVVYTD